MGDLEDLLLEAAGRTGASGRNRNSRPPARRQREASNSDVGSDSNDDSSGDELGYASRKPSGSQVPLKKRLDASEKDEDRVGRGDDDDYGDDVGSGSDESDVGSDLYKNDSDREQLARMSELDRELILSERAQRRDDQRLTERVRGKQSVKKTQPVKEPPGPPSSRVRSSARFAEKAAASNDALNELRAKRLKQQDPEANRKFKDAGRRNSVGRDSSPVRKKSARAASLSSDSSQSEDQSQSNSKDEESVGDEDLVESDDNESNGKDLPTLDDIKDITIRRSKLAKWFMEPFFEELIVGCFVRVGVGRRGNKNYYRLCIVKNVDATVPNQQYALENRRTHKYLNVTWGSKEARWQMAVISESPPLELEFNQWVEAMDRDGQRMPTRQDILEKKEAIQKAIQQFVYSPETVKQMLQEKKSASSRPLNVAAEKDRLRKQLDVAQSRQDAAEMERIQAKLQELNNSRQEKHKNDKAVKLEEMNKRNRAENFRNASEIKPVNTSLKAGEAGYDPFSRRWTRSRNYYVANQAGGDEAAADANPTLLETGEGNRAAAGATTEAGMATTAAALEAAAGAGKLVDTSAPIDLGIESNSMHDFDLPISLAKLQMFGGPQGAHSGFMARKQKVEATVGCRVRENDGRRHSLTLSVGDYKRRRGLL